jgi:hypothetical protein
MHLLRIKKQKKLGLISLHLLAMSGYVGLSLLKRVKPELKELTGHAQVSKRGKDVRVVGLDAFIASAPNGSRLCG